MLRQHWDDDGRVFRALAFVDGDGVGRHQGVKLAEAVGDGTSVEAGSKLALVGGDIHDISDVAVVDLLVVIISICMTLSPAANTQPNFSTLRSPAGFKAACSSMLSERAPTPPRFIGHSTWISRMGSRPKRRGMRVLTSSTMRGTAASGSSASTK